MKAVIALTVIVALGSMYFLSAPAQDQVSTAGLEAAFFSFINENGRQYKDQAEYDFRFTLFSANSAFIAEENQKGYSHTLGMNHFGDWTDAEFERTLGMKNSQKATGPRFPTPVSEPNESSFDWRDTTDAVHQVVDQGSCGSCWAFAVTAAYETAFFNAHKTQLNFAEQQLVDCAGGKYYNEGCAGGELSYAYQYLHDFHYAVEETFPYHAADETCLVNEDSITYPGDHVNFFIEHNNTNSADMKQMIRGNPVSVALEAKSFKFYAGGILDANTCGEDIDHGVLVVGYSTEGNGFYTIKNSWGKRWGEKGYIRIPMETEKTFVDGTCGILNRPSYPKLEAKK